VWKHWYSQETAALAEIDRTERERNNAAGYGRKTDIELEDLRASLVS
jgi:hypothetical protein